MSEYGFTKKDWSLFREKISDWQEAYMDKLNKEYIELLNGEGTPSEKFWTLEERIRNDKKDTSCNSIFYIGTTDISFLHSLQTMLCPENL